MKAATRSTYGTADVLSIEDVETPTPSDNEILIKVHATTVNRTDNAILIAHPFIMRFFTGLTKPKLKITGTDFAGEVQSIGKNVTNFKVGDRVMGFNGMGLQSHAEFVKLPKTEAIISIPDNLSYVNAAGCLEAPFYAYSLHKWNPRPGQNALVIGGTGAIGSSIIQLLKYYGVAMTAVCKGEHAELVKSLGANRTIDYLKEDFRNDKERYDFVFDAVGKSSFGKCKPLLKEKGIYSATDNLFNLILVPLTRLTGGKKVAFDFPGDVKTGLNFIRDLVVQGHFKPVIDRTYPLNQIKEAFRYVATGQKVGNVVISMI